jgi:hypothetical protein
MTQHSSLIYISSPLNMDFQEAHRVDHMAVRLYVSHLIIEGTKSKALLLQAKTVVQDLQEENSTLMSQMVEKDKLLAKAIKERDEAIATKTCNFCINISEKELVSCTKHVGTHFHVAAAKLSIANVGYVDVSACSTAFPCFQASSSAVLPGAWGMEQDFPVSV